ncbi:NADH-quinone oxidoreductase subunit L [Caldivirga sp. UBA161]|uniref:NADH-quinone oxidoreductase subunit 5 family protein n=1 Tax=Caldivirga sp. UBA161 TaxID=1915569 RepID=UPI0025C4AEA7|nr:NADH-quinone oxidoreductase subunit L [Caldivirga sp. UBA161]
MYESILPALIALMTLIPILFASPISVYWSIEQDNRKARPLEYLAVIGLGVAALASTYIAVAYPMRAIIYTYPWISVPGVFTMHVSFIVDFLSRYMGLLTAWLAFIIGVYSLEYMANDYRLGWFWFFYNTFAASMLLLVYSNNLLLMFIGWEGLGLSSWALIGNWFKDDDEITFVGKLGDTVLGKPAWTTPSYAAYRAIVTIRFGDMPMLGALAAIGIFGGSLDFNMINWGHLTSVLGTIGTAIVLIAFLLGPFTKSAQFPFNDWLLTAMTGPTSVSALLHSATMVAAGVYVFMRLTLSLYGAGVLTSSGVLLTYLVVIYVGLLTALLGSLFALAIDERKVILAGSTMASLGLMMGITAATPYLSSVVTIGEYVLPAAVLVAFLYLIIHALSKATLFLVSGHLIHETGTRFNVGDVELAKRMKLAFYSTIAAAITLGGVPPLAGYWIHASMDELVSSVSQTVGWGSYTLLILTSIAYVAFLARFTSLNFIKGGRVEHKEPGHGGLLMAISYALTATVALATVAVPFTIHAPSILVEPGYDAYVVGIGVFLWVIFITALIKPRAPSLSSLTTIFERRYYLQAFMDVILAGFGRALIEFAYLISHGIDVLFNTLIPSLFTGFSRVIRRVQVGLLNQYIRYIYLATVVMLIIVLILVMVYG